MKASFPWLALGLGLLLSLLLLAFSDGSAGTRRLPLLAALLISEFGLLVTAIAALVSLRDLIRSRFRQPLSILLVIGNLLLAAFFLRTGIILWPGSAGG